MAIGIQAVYMCLASAGISWFTYFDKVGEILPGRRLYMCLTSEGGYIHVFNVRNFSNIK